MWSLSMVSFLFFIILMLRVKYFLSYSHLLLMLLVSEALVIINGLLVSSICQLSMVSFNFILVMFLCAVIEACLGLSILVSCARMFGVDFCGL